MSADIKEGGNVLKIVSQYIGGTSPAKYSYQIFKNEPFYVKAGQVLKYEVFLEPSNQSFRGGLDVEFIEGNFRDLGIIDQNGIPSHPAYDLAAYAKGQWYERVFTGFGDATAGKVVSRWLLDLEGANTGILIGYFRNIRIEDANGKVLYWIYKDGAPPLNQPAYYVDRQADITAHYWNSPKLDKYLLSFDGKQSWLTFRDGGWQKISNQQLPGASDVRNYGMTSDEVNALGPDDFAQLYQKGEEKFSVDVAVLFQSPDPYMSPQLNGITVSMSGEDVIGALLQYPKEQVDYDSGNWRTIKRIYPIELQPKQADVVYFLSNDGGTTLQAYKHGQWTTYQATLLAQPSQNWSNIIQDGMTKEELKAIPADQLNTALLPAAKVSVVYVTEVDDTTTAGYTSKVTIDYTENQFVKNNLTLSIILTSGERQDFTGLAKSDVENFMEWLYSRQFNKGPVFYRIKTPGTDPAVSQNNYYINYYLVQKVEVKELN